MVKMAFPISNHKGLNDHIFEHFGHAPAFLIVEISEDKKVLNIDIIDNIYQETHSPGEVPSLLANKNVKILICKGIGRRAIELFEQSGIKVIKGISGRVKDVLKEYLSGKLESKDYWPRQKWSKNR